MGKSLISLPKDSTLNQGVIFTGAIAEQYNYCGVYGLIVTARCDIAHDKVLLYNYLPVVPFDKWMQVDFVSLILPVIKKEILSCMKSSLKNLGFSDSVLLTATPIEIFNTLVAGTATNKAKDSFKKYIRQLQSVEEIGIGVDKEKLVKIVNEFPSIRDDVVKRLVKQNLNGYYFLEEVDVNGKNNGYVVLLREVQSMPRYLASKLANGFSKDEFDYMIKENKNCDGKVSFVATDYVMPIAQLLSPNIEHLMQCFGNTFCRIGIKDIDDKCIDKIKKYHFSRGENE